MTTGAIFKTLHFLYNLQMGPMNYSRVRVNQHMFSSESLLLSAFRSPPSLLALRGKQKVTENSITLHYAGKACKGQTI